MNGDEKREARYAPAAVARLTGISAHALRAWERRYGAVEPTRTPGGARRYSDEDVTRLRLLRRATDAGHPIGEVASLPNEELRRRLSLADEPSDEVAPGLPVEALLEDVRALDVVRLERELSLQLAALGPRRFARDLASPLLRRIGDEWERGALSVAAEHAASSALRNLLGAALRGAPQAGRPTIVFATPSGERHELGTLIAAIDCLEAGARPVFLGPDLPVEEIDGAARRLNARAVAVGVVSLEPEAATRELHALRRALPTYIAVLCGGPAAANIAPETGIETIERLEDLERHVSRIA